MRRLMLAIAVLSFVLFPLASCIVHTPRSGYRRQHNCYRHCARFRVRRTCERRCSIYRNGVCVSFRQVCRQSRYCARYVRRCR